MSPPEPTTFQRFVLAGISNMSAAAVTNPIDVIKVRMQLEGELVKERSTSVSLYKDRYYRGWIRGALRIVEDEGVLGLYKGLAPSLLREGSYSTIRLGAYESFKELFGATDPAHTPLHKKILAGGCSGALGSAIATPTDLVKVRMQAEGTLGETVAKKHGYESVSHAFQTIWRSEGLSGLYRGMGPTVQRAAIVTATQISSYDHCKHTMINHQILPEGMPLHVVASMFAGFTTAVMSSPVDVIKTRIMNELTIGGTRVYKSTFDCLTKSIRAEGIAGLYKGFIPNWMRIGPHTIVTFLIFEQLRKMIGMRPV
eukprot:41230_1